MIQKDRRRAGPASRVALVALCLLLPALLGGCPDFYDDALNAAENMTIAIISAAEGFVFAMVNAAVNQFFDMLRGDNTP